MSNEPNLFATSFFQKIEDREKKKSAGNAIRMEGQGPCGPTTRPCGGGHLPLVSTQSWTARICLELKPTI
jgi:hypothetical protein